MKQLALKVEHMNHLQELGLETKNARMYYSGGSSSHMKLLPKTGNGKLHPGSIPAYTLEDLLEKFPNGIRVNKKDLSDVIKKSKPYYESDISYYFFDNYEKMKKEKIVKPEIMQETMLMCAYYLMCWCLENKLISKKYLKKEDKKDE